MCPGPVGWRVFWTKRTERGVTRVSWSCEGTRGWTPAASACGSRCTGRRRRRGWGPGAAAERGGDTAAPPWAAPRPARRRGKAYWRSSRGRSWRPCWAWPACWTGRRPSGRASLCGPRTRTGGRWPRPSWGPTAQRTRRWWPAAWPWFCQVALEAPTSAHVPRGSAAASAAPSASGRSTSSAPRRCRRAGSRWWSRVSIWGRCPAPWAGGCSSTCLTTRRRARRTRAITPGPRRWSSWLGPGSWSGGGGAGGTAPRSGPRWGARWTRWRRGWQRTLRRWRSAAGVKGHRGERPPSPAGSRRRWWRAGRECLSPSPPGGNNTELSWCGTPGETRPPPWGRSLKETNITSGLSRKLNLWWCWTLTSDPVWVTSEERLLPTFFFFWTNWWKLESRVSLISAKTESVFYVKQCLWGPVPVPSSTAEYLCWLWPPTFYLYVPVRIARTPGGHVDARAHVLLLWSIFIDLWTKLSNENNAGVNTFHQTGISTSWIIEAIHFAVARFQGRMDMSSWTQTMVRSLDYKTLQHCIIWMGRQSCSKEPEHWFLLSGAVPTFVLKRTWKQRFNEFSVYTWLRAEAAD